MNFAENTLPDFVIADLYKSTLVSCGAENIVQEQPIVPVAETTAKYTNPIAYLGENKKKIVIVVQEDNAVHIEEDNFAFLSNILAACKLNIADVAIINQQKQTTSFSAIKEQLQPQFIILFDLGLEQINLPMRIPKYRLQNYAGCTFLIAAAFSKMLDNSQEAKMEKSKLWLSLKNMFGI